MHHTTDIYAPHTDISMHHTTDIYAPHTDIGKATLRYKQKQDRYINICLHRQVLLSYQSINTFITRHGTEARATVRIMPKQREMS